MKTARLRPLSARSAACARWLGILPALLAAAWLSAVTPRAGAAGAHSVIAQRGMVVAQDRYAAEAGAAILRAGGNAIDAAVATAFVLAVTHPAAGNLGGGGFIIYRAADGKADAYDFREVAPARATENMFLRDARYDPKLHHHGALAVGVPGTVAGLHLAWSDHGRLPWKRLLEPAITLAHDGFPVSYGLARSLQSALPKMQPYPASISQYSKRGVPYQFGDRLRQPDLAGTLRRISKQGPAGFYQGETAELIQREMNRLGGLITREDLGRYQAKRRVPVRGSYRGHAILSMPPPSSGGVVLVQMLRVLEGFDLAAAGCGSAQSVHWIVETMRRGFADRARWLGDPEFNPDLPLERLLSAEHAARQRRSIRPDRASISTPDQFEWPVEGAETTHLSVVDADRNAVSLTYTLEESYGAGIVIPGAGFLMNNEMGDFNPALGMTTAEGLIGTAPNLVRPGKRMLSSMTPTIVEKDGAVRFVLGSPGGRTIINTVLLTLLNLVDFGMNLQDAVNAPRFHHQWLPDVVRFERRGLSPDTLDRLRAFGHELQPVSSQGFVAAIKVDPATGLLEGAADGRAPDSAAAGW